MKISAMRSQLLAQFQAAGLAHPADEVTHLLWKLMGIDRLMLLEDGDLAPEAVERITAIAARRAAHEPFDRIEGSREFYGHSFVLNADTLSPRADTETLVELVLDNPAPNARILDLGTGTGCILLALLKALPQAKGVGVDVSDNALAAARKNAEALDVLNAEFILSNWFTNVSGTFDIIVSNPPYIPSRDIETLDGEVRNHDPLRALDGGDDGLQAYRAIFSNARTFLKPGGRVAVEIGRGQEGDVERIAATNGFALIVQKPDLAGIIRALSFK